MATRGVVISPPVESDETGGAVTSKTIDETALRQYVLYWDKIDLPDNDLIGYGIPPEIPLLKEEGILQQTLIRVVRPNSGPVLQQLRGLGYDSRSGDMEIDFGNWFGSRLNAQMQLEAFLRNNQQSGEEWSIAQPNRFLELPQDSSIPSRTVEVELYQAIPVPTADVPMEEVLDFRQQRQDEVLAFRYAMDELYLSIIDSSDIPRAKTVAVRKIEQSLADLNAVAKERRWGLERPSLRIGLNPLNLALSMFTNIQKVSSNLDLPTVTEFVGRAAISSLNITIGSAIRRPKQIPEHLKAYSYLHYIENLSSRFR